MELMIERCLNNLLNQIVRENESRSELVNSLALVDVLKLRLFTLEAFSCSFFFIVTFCHGYYNLYIFPLIVYLIRYHVAAY